jgi:F0F1-type ATP synthase membrane subunit b/b'
MVSCAGYCEEFDPALMEVRIMPEKQMKDRIAEELKKAKDAGQITKEKVADILKTAVSDAAAGTRGRLESVRTVVKNAVVTGVEALKDAGIDAKENIEGVVEGAISGVRHRADRAVEAAREEFRKIETRLEDEKTGLAQSIREGLEGAKEAGTGLPEEVRNRLESAAADVKLKSAELLGLTRETVKEAVKKSIESGKDVKETVVRITKDVAERAVKEGRLNEDAGKFGKRPVDFARGAISGMWEGAKEVIEKTKKDR